MADCSGYKAPKTSDHGRCRSSGAADQRRRGAAGAAAHPEHRDAQRRHRTAAPPEAGVAPRAPSGRATRSRAWTRSPGGCAGVPVGPRAGRAHDRPAHGRGGLRAGRRRPPRRRRQAARRARRRAVPGPLPVAAARGARRRRPGPGRRARDREADPPPPARVRRGRGRRPPSRCCATGTRSSATSPGASRACSARCPRTCRRCCTRARSSAGRPRAASTSRASSGRCRRSATSSTSSSRPTAQDERFHELGDVLFAAVNVARKLKVDPELALRSASGRFRAARGGRRSSSRHPRAEVGTILRPSSSSPTTPAHG